tara:strand:+ start:1343 stop:1870 length:528 start_codon:yes stop_codon:yes gene_type:complete
MKNLCDWNNCYKNGEYRAPIQKDNSKKYRLLCLEHIKEFNKKWDYFSGMTNEEIYNFIKSDMTWHKPTQNFGSSDNFFSILWKNALNDEKDNSQFINGISKRKNTNFNSADIKAFSILNIEVGEDWKKIKTEFKKLVKKYHPDMNSGNKKFEEKLKIITLAYNQLKNTYKGKIDT